MSRTINPSMTACKSSQIHSHGYDAATNTLVVQFNSGHVYHYHGVKADKYANLQKAESVGSFLHSQIKGKHEHVRIDNAKKD